VTCFKKHKVRPLTGDAHPEITVEKYCVYDEPHKDYLYTQEWVEFLIDEQRPLVPAPVPAAQELALCEVATN